MDRRSFRLGPAMLKTADSAEHVPDTWRTALLTEHLEGADAPALAQTSKPALHLLLAEWPVATLTVPVRAASAERPEELLRRAQSAREQIALRGGQATTLVLEQRGYIGEGEAWWHVAFAALATRSKVLPSFTLNLQLQHQPSELFCFAGRAFPGLTSLSIGTPSDGTSTVQLPPPAALPTLTALTVGTIPAHAQSTFWASVTPYLAQLSSLSIGQQPEPAEPEPQPQPEQVIEPRRPAYVSIFSGAARARKLTRLSLPCALQPWLTVLLQRHAPALQELTVTGARFRVPAEPAALVCSWSTLKCREGWLYEDGVERMPLPAEGKLTIELQQKGAAVSLSLPVSEAVAQKLALVHIQGCAKVRVTCDPGMPDTQAAALQSALPHIAPLQAAGVGELEIVYATLSDGLIAAVAAAGAAGWPRLSLYGLFVHPHVPPPITATLPPLHTLDIGSNLTDAVLAQLLQCCSTVHTLSVWDAELQSAVPESTVLPWQTTRVIERVELEPFLAQARLLGHTAWDLEGLELTLTVQEADSGEAALLAKQLATVRLQAVSDFILTCDEDTPSAHAARVLRAGLAVARALPCEPRYICLVGWPATEPVVAQLTHLPPWSTAVALQLASCDELQGKVAWPLARAPWLIPSTYSKWFVEVVQSCVSQPEFEVFVWNAPSNRTKEHPLTIEISCETAEALAAEVDQRLRLAGTYPHVRVVPYNEQ